MANMGYDWWNSNDNTTTGWTDTRNTVNTVTERWHRRLRGPQYSVRQCTLILVEGPDHHPQTYANIAGVQFKRFTRRGKRHYYRTVQA